MDRTAKSEMIDDLKGLFAEAGVVVVTRYSGLSVKELTELRAKLREKEASFKVVKNRLVKKAIDGSDNEVGADLFVGPTGIAYSSDPVASAKVAVDFAKSNDKLIVVGAILDGQRLDEAGVKALAELPSIDELRAQILGLIQTPAAQVAGLLTMPGQYVVNCIHQKIEQEEAA